MKEMITYLDVAEAERVANRFRAWEKGGVQPSDSEWAHLLKTCNFPDEFKIENASLITPTKSDCDTGVRHEQRFLINIDPNSLHRSRPVYRGLDLLLLRSIVAKFGYNDVVNRDDSILSEARAQSRSSHLFTNPAHTAFATSTDTKKRSESFPVCTTHVLISPDQRASGRETLSSLIATDSLSQKEIFDLVEILCHAIDKNKDQPHRDLKPGNIIWGNGVLRLIDFSLNQDLITEQTYKFGKSRAPGTPAYMSPERFEADTTCGVPSELYSLGLITYELFTRTVRFRYQNYHHIYDRMIYNPELSKTELELLEINGLVTQRNKDYTYTGATIDTVLNKLHTPDPTLRHQTGAELARDFREAMFAPRYS